MHGSAPGNRVWHREHRSKKNRQPNHNVKRDRKVGWMQKNRRTEEKRLKKIIHDIKQ